MRKVSFLSLVVVIALLSCRDNSHRHLQPPVSEGVGEPGKNNDKGVSQQVRGIVLGIAGTNIVMGASVGIAGTRPEQWDRYEALRANATDDELVVLTGDSNAVVRCYAFKALTEKKTIDPFTLVLRHLSDTATVHTLNGCIGGSQKVGDYFLEMAPVKQQGIVDSLLLYERGNNLVARDMMLSLLKPLEKYYKRVRQLAVEENDRVAIVTLAKFRKPQDIPVIERYLKDSNDISGRRFDAVRYFPDPAFYPYLEKALKYEIKNDNGNDLQELYYAIVQYKNKASRDLLKFALSKAKNMEYIHHSDYLSQALREYPAPIYEGLVKPVYTGRPLR